MSYTEIPHFTNPFIHPNATAFGMIEYGTSVSIWPGAVVRADMNQIKLGSFVNIQDNSTLHTDSTSPISIGEYTLVGHNVMIHGCKIGRAVLIGIGSIVLDNAEIGDGSQIAAGCMIRGGKKIPPRSLVVPDGSDIKIFERKAKPELTVAGCIEYAHLSVRFAQNQFLPFQKEEEVHFVTQAKEILLKLGI
ncbi:gamma carbonic anhydrase family protein [Leptospira biflexa]|uniref:gamma carbonic anhydrase family protein n=1 Tax=Leptospira biflexa TaxID=172 RepID=UPI00108291ED|nr:gamma carbonic anhydrase family protein [Leptospira biflexa]TGM37771.1 gamma carbonic anhydrase family protein [Leptospira biflexa]TGM41105.1 gamma carbonic anhydrase family protein [Leptospira biflexa]